LAVLALTDAEILAGPLRLTGRSNEISVDLEAVALDVTTFDSDGWNEHIAGLRNLSASVKGFRSRRAPSTSTPSCSPG
jgi:predicted secreted protein